MFKLDLAYLCLTPAARDLPRLVKIDQLTPVFSLTLGRLKGCLRPLRFDRIIDATYLILIESYSSNPCTRVDKTADRGSRGIRDQPRNPPKYTEKRIRINFPFPCPSRGQLPPVGVGSFRGYGLVMIFLAVVIQGPTGPVQAMQ